MSGAHTSIKRCPINAVCVDFGLTAPHWPILGVVVENSGSLLPNKHEDANDMFAVSANAGVEYNRPRQMFGTASKCHHARLSQYHAIHNIPATGLTEHLHWHCCNTVLVFGANASVFASVHVPPVDDTQLAATPPQLA
jgi:hypothetical protein